MSDKTVDIPPIFDRVSIRAVLVREGEDPSAALAAAGIFDPIAIPVIIGEDPQLSGGILGDGITPNLIAVLETTHEAPDGPSRYTPPAPSRRNADDAQPARTETIMRPPAFGRQPLAPVRRIVSADVNASSAVMVNPAPPPAPPSETFNLSQEEIEKRYYDETFGGLPVTQSQHSAMRQGVAGFAGAGALAGGVIGSMTEGAEVGSVGGPTGVLVGAAIGLVIGGGFGLMAGGLVGTQEDKAQGIPPLSPSARR